MPSIIEGTQNFTGAVVLSSVTLPASCVTNAKIEAGAGISASKQQHLHSKCQSQRNGTINASQRELIHLVTGATGTLKSFKAYNITTATATDTTTIDLLKNGSTMLSAVITLNAAATTVVQSATFASTSVVAGDKLEVNVVATGAAPGQGLSIQVTLEEDY
jgi:hypothetical protein